MTASVSTFECLGLTKLTPDARRFNIEVIDQRCRSYPKIAVRAGGVVLAWRDEHGAQLLQHDKAGWTRERVTLGTCGAVGIATDAQGDRYIAYDRYDEGRESIQGDQSILLYAKEGARATLEVARWDGKDWRRETVASGLWDFCRVDHAHFAVACGGGRLALAYVCNGVFLAEWEDGAWRVAKVIAKKDAGLGEVALALDSSGAPHVLSNSHDDDLPRYSTRVDGTWRHEKIGEKHDGGFPTIAVDGSGSVHVAYMHEGTHDRVVYGVRSVTGAWSMEKLDDAGNNGFGASLVLDHAGRPHLTYRKQKTRRCDLKDQLVPAQIRYAVRNAVWRIETLAEAGWANAIAIAADGAPYVAFRTTMKGGLSLAHQGDGVLGGVPPDVAPPSNAEVRETALAASRAEYRARRDRRSAILRASGRLYMEREWFGDHQFWEITCVGNAIATRSGKVGKAGRRVEKAFPTFEAAMTFATKQIEDHDWDEQAADGQMSSSGDPAS